MGNNANGVKSNSPLVAIDIGNSLLKFGLRLPNDSENIIQGMGIDHQLSLFKKCKLLFLCPYSKNEKV